MRELINYSFATAFYAFVFFRVVKRININIYVLVEG